MTPSWTFAVDRDDLTRTTVADGPVPDLGDGAALLRVDRVDAAGFRDSSAHRGDQPSPYNAYRATTGGAAYRAAEEDLLVLFRPLFFTSFMLADYLADNEFFGAATLVLSSASSKTAYTAAFELRGRVPRV